MFPSRSAGVVCWEVVMVVLVVGIVVVGLALAAVTFGLARWAARQDQRIDQELRPEEAVSGRCGACLGRGWRFVAYGHASGPGTCWRCGGSGVPPAPGVASNRNRYAHEGP
jgi:hypothetical protein